jgi:GT2 family glycosyltransferase/glycosyltransferase involved in cell wall biosynthesis
VSGNGGTSSSGPRTQAEHEGELAHVAWQRGQAARAAGDHAGARGWLERARRLAPEDALVTLLLAMTLYDLGDPAAAELFEDVANRHAAREAWLGLVTARRRQGQAALAAAALAKLLSRHALVPGAGFAALADAVAVAANEAGWCGLCSDGVLVVGPLSAPPPAIEIDGAAVRGGAVIVPAPAGRVSVSRAGRPLLGSPIDAAAIRRLEGFVAGRADGALEGWAWYPSDAARDPTLLVTPLGGGPAVRLTATDIDMTPPRPLARPRRFLLPSTPALLAGPLSVTGADGRDLTGSPLDPGAPMRSAALVAALVARAWPAPAAPRRTATARLPTLLAVPADIVGWPVRSPMRPRRRVAVVVPVYRGLRPTLDCLEAVLATLPRGGSLIVVDDASPEPALVAGLDRLAARRRIRLLRHARNRGFPAAANAGLRAAIALPGAPDVVLLNSDTRPAPGWIEGLRAALHAATDVGTATPLSNDASLLSYPDPRAPSPQAAPERPAELARLAALANPATTVDIPTAVGFCMYIRRECLLQTGVFREDLFAQGYGEENDFCLRARHLGWRHVAVPGVYVAHLGGQSFGDARAQLLRRNIEVLNRLHPGYDALIAAWQARDPLAESRRRLGALRWAEARRGGGRAFVLVTHDSGGGVERAVRERCAALRADGLRPVLLRPVIDRSGQPASAERRYLPGLCEVGEGIGHGFPELRFRLPDELPLLADLLRPDRPVGMQVHHLLGHDHSILDLARMLQMPYEIAVHDYAWFCPQISLLDPSHRYCGEPDVGVCAQCVADAGSQLEEAITPATLRQRSAADLAGARQVTAPSADAAARIRRHFPAVRVDIVPHEAPPGGLRLLAPPAGPRRVCLVGAIGREKGYDVLLQAARDAAARDLPLDFVVVGYSIDDERLEATGRVFVTGPYRDPEVEALIRAQSAHLAWLASICPETWCYTLGQAWRAGLRVVAFDIGAQAERIREHGGGWLLPPGLPAPAVNNALLAVRAPAGNECATPTGDVQMRNHPVNTSFVPGQPKRF